MTMQALASDFEWFAKPLCNGERGTSEGRTGGNEPSERNERATYIMLERTALAKHGIAYRTRVPWQRSSHSSPRTGKPSTWRRGTGNPMIQEF
jgi:hypothetical protein